MDDFFLKCQHVHQVFGALLNSFEAELFWSASSMAVSYYCEV